MNEFALHRPSTFWPPSPLQNPSLVFLPLTLSSCAPATSCRTFPLQCAYVSERMLVRSQSGGRYWPEANFCGQTSVYPDGLQASRGSAPSSSSIPSAWGLSRVFANSRRSDIFWLLQGKSGAFILKDRLCTCESRQVTDDEEEGRGNNTESGFQCFVKGSLGLTCSSIFLKKSCLKMAACLFAYLPGCCCSCSLSFMCKVSGCHSNLRDSLQWYIGLLFKE